MKIAVYWKDGTRHLFVWNKYVCLIMKDRSPIVRGLSIKKIQDLSH